MSEIYDKKSAVKVIGALIKNPDILIDDRYNLIVDDFQETTHRTTFFAIYNMYKAGQQNITEVSILEYLKQYDQIYHNFIKNSGDKFLLSVVEIADLKSFKFDYDRVKKMSVLRDYQEGGIDISEWYSDSTYDLALKQQKILKLEQASVQDIINSMQLKVSEVESKHIDRQSFKVGKGFEGLEQLLENLKAEPAVGLAGEGRMFTTIVRGMRKAKFYLFSADSGQGKSRIGIANASKMAFPIRWSVEKGKWINEGSSQKVLFVTTELEFPEVQTIILANITGINEEKILFPDALSEEESKRMHEGVQIWEHFQENLILFYMPDPNIAQVETSIKKLAIKHQLDAVFYDYIHTSPSLINEFSGARIREDVALGMLSASLKSLANNMDLFVWSSTQMNRTAKEAYFSHSGHVRGSTAIVDKTDVSCVARQPLEEHYSTISKLMKSESVKPTHMIDFFKNRGSRLNSIRLWVTIDLGTGRFKEHFITTPDGDLVSADIRYSIDSNAKFDEQEMKEIIYNKKQKEKTKTEL